MIRRWFFLMTVISILTMVALLCISPGLPRDQAALGKILFFDTILSSDKSISCASCHKPQFAFADTSAVSLGVHERKGVRNTPSAMNVDQQPHFFWDDRARTLEEQALMPVANPMEMDLHLDSAITRLRQDPFYIRAFERVFKELPDTRNMARALAAFQQTLETGDTPFDEWRINNDPNAVSASARHGYTLFNGKAGCVRCHFDSGRAAITHAPRDLGKFKIGPLRNIALTAPYMHNGMFRTLREVIRYYNDPDKVVPHPVNRDTLLSQPLHLTDTEITDLESFLRSLTGRQLSSR